MKDQNISKVTLIFPDNFSPFQMETIGNIEYFKLTEDCFCFTYYWPYFLQRSLNSENNLII